MTQQHPSEQPSAYRQGRYRPPAGAADVLLIRHGQSADYHDGTPFPLTGGHGDPPLSDLGHEQAALVAARLASAAIDAIYVTTLQRTVQTAAPLAEALGLVPRLEPDLREVHLGDWEAGLYRKMVAEQHPIAQRMLAAERWDVVPGAERAEALADRVRIAINGLATAHPDQLIAVFTHGGIIGQALALATKSRPFAFIGADNASISRLVVAVDQWTLRGFNDTAHLDQPG